MARRMFAFAAVTTSMMLVAASVADDALQVSKKLRTHVGEQAVAVFSSPSKVEVFLIDPLKKEKPPENNIAGYAITITGEEQSVEFAKKLGSVLLQDKTYFNPNKFCAYSPGVAFRIWKDKESVEVIVCYQCNGLEVFARNAKGERVSKKAAWGDFDPMRPALVRLAKQAFPKEQDVQALNEQSIKK